MNKFVFILLEYLEVKILGTVCPSFFSTSLHFLGEVIGQTQYQ